MAPPVPLVEVSMVRETLAGLPVFPLPAGFSLRRYRRGDDLTWTRIQQEAERYHEVAPELFHREFAGGEAQLPERQFFLCDGARREIGTGTAWYNDDYHGQVWGRIHWVAVAASHQRQGLGRVLVSALCQRFLELQHVRAYLTTESIRLPALRLYLSFGFLPEIKDAADHREWDLLRTRGLPWNSFASPSLPL